MSQTKEITLQNFEQLCTDFFKQKALIAEKQAEVDAMKDELDEHKRTLLAFMESHEKEKHFVKGHGTIYIKERFTVPTPKSLEEKKTFFDYLEKRGIFLEMASVNSQTLNSFYKTEMETAIAEGNSDFKLPGIGEPTMSRTLETRKGN